MLTRWTRWQDWVALAAGLYAALAPLWSTSATTATWTMVILGGLLVVNALWSLMIPGAIASEWIHVAFGLMLIIAPWVMGYTDVTALSVGAWGSGAVALITGVWAVPYSYRAHSPGHA